MTGALGDTSSSRPLAAVTARPKPEPVQASVQFSAPGALATQSATLKRDAFVLQQIPPVLESGVGSTSSLPSKGFIASNTAMVSRSLSMHEHYPPPLQHHIGEEDLPGGFNHSINISGQSAPFQDLARGVIQLDGIAVLFNRRA